MLIPCWSVPQIMSHLTCDRVELSLHVWLENSFSVEPQKWVRPQWPLRRNSVWRWHVIQYKSMFIDIHEWLPQVFISLQRRPLKKRNCWNVLKYMWFLYPVSFQRTKGSEIWIFPPGVFGNSVLHDVYRGHISSVNLHNVNFSGIKKNNLFLACRRLIAHVIRRE